MQNAYKDKILFAKPKSKDSMFAKDFKSEESPKQTLDVNRYFVPTQTILVENVS